MMGQSKTAYIQWTIVGVLFLIFWYVQSLAKSIPIDFPLHKTFTVEENETLKSMSLRLEEGHYVNSALLFRVFVSSRGIDRHIKAGGYSFDESLSLDGVVEKFATGHPDVPLVSLTVPEGSSVNEIASFVHKAIPAISEEAFLSLVNLGGFSGRLFPSTYFLLPSTTAESIIKMMKSTFENKYKTFVQGLTMPVPLTSDTEVLSLAAILEGEAKTKGDMEIVAGILLARLQKGMALQVDAAPETYTKRGLPLVPINNPGENAISAVFHASSSPYLYYITGKDGLMHYATTFEEHKRNIGKYLR